MIYDITKKFQFHIELTDKCNARCPQCSRNVINKENGQLQERPNLAFSEITIDNFKSIFVKYMNISKTKKPLITHVVTKLVVSTTLDTNPLLLSVEH